MTPRGGWAGTEPRRAASRRGLRSARRGAPTLLLATSLALLLTLAAVSPGQAGGSAAPGPVPGLRTASVANLTLAAKAYSHGTQTSAGTMILTADDSTSSQLGWSVTIQASAFVWTSDGTSAGGVDIPAANFSLNSAAAPAMTSGQAIDPTGGPKIPAASPVGTLDIVRKPLQADATFGNGTYTQSLGVSLVIPARSRAGTYTGTLTTTIAAGP